MLEVHSPGVGETGGVDTRQLPLVQVPNSLLVLTQKEPSGRLFKTHWWFVIVKFLQAGGVREQIIGRHSRVERSHFWSIRHWLSDRQPPIGVGEMTTDVGVGATKQKPFWQVPNSLELGSRQNEPLGRLFNWH